MRMFIHLFHEKKFAILKKRIKINPYLGQEYTDGTYEYKRGNYRLRYRILNGPANQKYVEWISEKRRLNSYEEAIRKISKSLFNFFCYQKWLIFFRPPVIYFLIISSVMVYFGLIETQKTKIGRLRWVIASLSGVSVQDIEYIGDGWLQISAQRKTAVDRIHEPVKYTISPLRWLFVDDAGFVGRWRGQEYQYVTHPVVYNERGDVWLNKDNSWRHGVINGRTIHWDLPQGTGIRTGKVIGHEISSQSQKLFVGDTAE